MRNIKFINREWFYRNDFKEEYLSNDFNYDEFEKIELPHSNKILPLNCFNEEEYAFISTYIKNIEITREQRGKKIFLDFEGVMIAADIYCNGTLVGSHEGGYTFFEVELTDYVNYGEKNKIVVKVDSRERRDIPPYGNVVDYLTFGGIYREVSLRVVEENYIDKAFFKTVDCLKDEKVLEGELKIKNSNLKKVNLKISLLDYNSEIISMKEESFSLELGENIKKISLRNLKDIKLWGTENPYLYGVIVELFDKNEKIDEINERVGFREAKFKGNGFFLNGEQIKIVGLNRHQSYPYVGYAMPKRVQERDAEILKNDLAVNLVRCSHYPQSKHFLNCCDELGLLVFEEIPGWQHIGDKLWQEKAKNSVREMIVRDFNHPSIILWGVRINESEDNHDFYKATNEIARDLDDSRQTAGVRYILGSELLEDVYSFNDFIYEGGEIVLRTREEVVGHSKAVPYLVTENNGHIYPTKSFDHEEKIVNQAHRHLKVIDEALGREDLAGTISWCAFDYNTHSAFGSGDKICHHGVCDIFRNLKYAGEGYRSQKDSKDEVVLEVISNMARGERDKGGIVPFDIFTNCDYIKLYRNDEYIDSFSGENSRLYKNLKHKPIKITHLLSKAVDFNLKEDEEKFRKFIFEKIELGEFFNLSKEDMDYAKKIIEKHDCNVDEIFGIIGVAVGGWGDKENSIKVEGYLNDKLVIEKTVSERKSMDKITIKADCKNLISTADSYDCTRIEVNLLDNLGNKLRFSNEVIKVEVKGAGELIGPKMLPLITGSTAFWIKTIGNSGEIKIKVEGNYLKSEEILYVN
ncbi:MAG: glycoside hydrolase family 2 TIM barrel-domain containing protein [Sarcina sp.]